MCRNLDERIANNTLDVIRFIPTIVSNRSTLYFDVKIIWNRIMTRMPDAKYWSMIRLLEQQLFPSLDLDLSTFIDSFVFLINMRLYRDRN